MIRNFLFFAALLGILSLNAQLPFDQNASVFDHMKEVNAEWVTMNSDPSLLKTTIAFNNENHRIRTHLELVIGQLLLTRKADFSPIQQQNRERLLHSLSAYAMTERFPINTKHTIRQPYFIDEFGTACAVGYMMIQDQNMDLALTIKETNNYAYVEELLGPELLAWAGNAGFTAEELAWIQPGYPPNTSWTTPGGGTNGTVDVVIPNPEADEIIIAGNFTEAGGVICQQVCSWDGLEYSQLADGVNGTISCAEWHLGKLYLGGSFNVDGGFQDLAVWDGTSWTYETPFVGKYNEVTALYNLDGDLYSAGFAAGFAGNSYYIASKSGSTWTILNANINGAIHALNQYDNQLVLGGEFTGLIGTDDVMHVATWTGTEISQLGVGLDNTVRSFTTFEGELYAGGDFFDDSENPSFGLASYDGSSWENEINTLNFQYGIDLSQIRINDLQVVEDTLYAAGSFNIEPLVGIIGSNLGSLDKENDYFNASVVLDSAVNDIAWFNNKLYVAGKFSSANFLPAPFIAYRSLSTSILSQIPIDLHIEIFPNPSSDRILVKLPSDIDARNLQIQIMDVSGRIIPIDAPEVLNGEISIKKGELNSGSYIIHITENGQLLGTGQFIFL